MNRKINGLGMATVITLALLAALPAMAADDVSFFRNGDRWVLNGDSITHTDTYP